MKIYTKLLFVAISMVGLSMPLTAQSIEPRTFEIMSYNVRNGIGMDNVRDLKRTADVIRRAGVEVVALQELDSLTGRSGRVDVLAELATLTGLKPTYAKAIAYDGGAYGIGILSRTEPIAVQRVALPGAEEARVLLIADFADYTIFATHLSLTDADQCTSLVMIDSLAAIYDARTGGRKPIFMAGDLNFIPDVPQIKLLRERFVLLSDSRRATFPASEPVDCIDYIWGYKGGEQCFDVLSAKVVDAPVESDHRPIAVKVRAGDLIRTAPYLQRAVEGGVTVTWLTNAPAYSWVEWGSDSNNMQRARTMYDGQAVAGNDLNKIRIEGLEDEKTYYYRICSRELLYYGGYEKVFGAEAVSPIYSFKTPSAAASDFTAFVFNDLHQRRATLDTLLSVARANRQGDPDFVIFNGDCIDDPQSRDQAASTIGHFTRAVGASQVPVFFMRGNHEIRGAYSVGLRDLYDYIDGRSYGAFSWGDNRFVMLDCGEDKPDSHPVYYDFNDFEGLRRDQVGFLKAEMASPAFTKASKRILLHHIPIYGELDSYSPCTELWSPIFTGVKGRKPNFNVALNGHTHRFDSYTVGEAGNPFPVVVGGGPAIKEATVTILSRRDSVLTLTVLSAAGEKLLELQP